MTYSPDLKARVITHVRTGGSQLDACRLFRVDRKTIYNWLRPPALFSPKIRRTRARKLDKTLLASHVRQFPDALLRERAVHFNVSSSSIWRSLQRMNFVKKND